MEHSNPYNWITRTPEPAIKRVAYSRLYQGLGSGERFVLAGGHGMGKTVLLTALAQGFDPDAVNAVLIDEKASDYSVKGCTLQLARKLGLTGEFNSIRDLFETWFDSEHSRHVILLFDEIDHYVDDTSVARDYFNALASAHSLFPNQLGVVIAGGLSVYRLQSEIGSDYTNAATLLYLRPFDREDIEQLASRFADRGRGFDTGTLASIHDFTGGNPRLVAYVLQQCWNRTKPIGPGTIFDIGRRFREEHQFFIHAVYRGLGIEEANSSANRIWHYIDQHNGPYRRASLIEAATTSPPDLDMNLQLLRASGLLEADGPVDVEDLDARAIPSFLRPLGPLDTEPSDSAETREEQLDRDLQRALGRIRRWGLDFYTDKDKKQLVPESVFSASLAIQLAEAGWHVHREAMQGPGFVDIVLDHPRFPDPPDSIVEVKLWENPDDPHDQVTSYHAEGAESEQRMAVVVIAGLTLTSEDIEQRYLDKRLPAAKFNLEPFKADAPLAVHVRATKKSGDGSGIPVRHYVLNLPRRRRRR